jgi:hypothetical protein
MFSSFPGSFNRSLSAQTPATHPLCQSVLRADAQVDETALLKLLTIPERQNKSAVHEILQDPYCQLPEVEIRAGVTANREVYPLTFDPDVWLVILYEGDEYAGYAFDRPQ